jgi:cold shock CspA family protein
MRHSASLPTLTLACTITMENQLEETRIHAKPRAQVPATGERKTGYVSAVKFGYGFIQTDSKAYFVHASQMPCDDLGRRYLLPNEEVSFVVGTHNNRPCAMAVELLTPRAMATENEYEEGSVCKIGRRGEYCFVLRPYDGN